MLLQAAIRGLLGHAAGQLLSHERHASIGLTQLLGSIWRAGSGARHVLSRLRREVEPLQLEPVAQAQGAQHVIAVVGLDRGQDVGSGALTFPELEPGLELDDARARVAQALRTLELIELFDPLDRVALDGGAQPLPDRPEEIDEHATAQEPIHPVLARPVPAHRAA